MATKCSARAVRKCWKLENVNILGVSLSVLIYMRLANGGNTSEILYSIMVWPGGGLWLFLLFQYLLLRDTHVWITSIILIWITKPNICQIIWLDSNEDKMRSTVGLIWFLFSDCVQKQLAKWHFLTVWLAPKWLKGLLVVIVIQKNWHVKYFKWLYTL